MTGHQPHPGVDLSHMHLTKNPISIEAAVKGLGVEKTLTVNPFHYRKTVNAVRELADWRGVSVLVARAPCPLYERTLPGFKKKRPFFVKRKNAAIIGCAPKKSPARHSFSMTGESGSMRTVAPAAPCALQICPENAILPVSRKEADA
jgi:indolepyruvate ferredoxin oxidoreductase, alpha subunit